MTSRHAVSPLVGRSAELISLVRQVGDPLVRILAITGAPGMGKTRLGVELLHSLAVNDGRDHPPQLPAALDVARLSHSDELVDAVCDHLGTPRRDVQSLIEHLGTSDSVVVLDNCDHLAKSIGELALALVAGCPRLTFVAIGIAPLGVYGERVFRLLPLATPAALIELAIGELSEIPAVQLLVSRTQASRPDFVVTRENQNAIAELCRCLDGVPLGIELAAARLKLASPRALVTAVRQEIGILHGTPADTLSEHLSMHSAISAHYAVLDEVEQRVLGQLATFESEFNASAARYVIGREIATPDPLERLVAKSMLVVRERPGGEIDFRMLAMTRLWVRDVLRNRGELNEARRRHAAYLCGVAGVATSDLTGSNHAVRSGEIDYWFTDMRAGFRYLRESSDGEGAVALAVALRQYWLTRGKLAVGVAWLSEALTLGGQSEAVRACALECLADLSAQLGQWRLASEQLGVAKEIYRELGDRHGLASCQYQFGRLAYLQGELTSASNLLEQAARAKLVVGERSAAAYASRDLAQVRVDTGDLEAARLLSERTIDEFECLSDPRGIGLAHLVAADEANAAGQYDRADRHFRQSLASLYELGERPAIAECFENASLRLAAQHGRTTASWHRTTHLLGAASALREQTGSVIPDHRKQSVIDLAHEARVRLGDATFDTLWRAAIRAPLRVTVEEALAPLPTASGLADIARDMPLTSREYEVAELVAVGLTNREVGRRLGIAEWTVVNHLRKVMRKLDCSSRVQVTRWVASHQNKIGDLPAHKTRR